MYTLITARMVSPSALSLLPSIFETIPSPACQPTTPPATPPVHAYGQSNGAAMVYRLGCEAADVFASVIPFEGSPPPADYNCTPSEPIHLLHIHGTDDHTVYYGRHAISCLFDPPPTYTHTRTTHIQYRIYRIYQYLSYVSYSLDGRRRDMGAVESVTFFGEYNGCGTGANASFLNNATLANAKYRGTR